MDPRVAQMIYRFDPCRIMRAAGIEPDPWQHDLLFASERLVLANTSRQVGKSTTTSARVLHQSLISGSLSILVAPSLRQSSELFRKFRTFAKAVGILKVVKDTALTMEFSNGSRVIALPGSEDTVRGFSSVNLLIVDEAAYVPDGIYRGVRPMLAVSQGQMICLTTPAGKRGFFHDAWQDDAVVARRFLVTWKDCPRIPVSFIEAERRALGPFFEQEYEGVFLDLLSSVFPGELIDRAFADDIDLDALGIPVAGPLVDVDDDVEALVI